MAVEVTRLLGEQLAYESEARIRRPPDDPLVMLCKRQLAMLEEFILKWVIPEKPAEAIESIRLLQTNIKDLRNRREKSSTEAQLLLHERATARATPVSKQDPFAALLRGCQEDKSQHNLPERRRLNLLAELNKRPRGTRSLLAKAMGRTLPQLSQLISDPASKCHRTISDDVARTMELALRLKRGELDRIELRPHVVSIQKSVAQLTAVAKKLRRQ